MRTREVIGQRSVELRPMAFETEEDPFVQIVINKMGVKR